MVSRRAATVVVVDNVTVPESGSDDHSSAKNRRVLFSSAGTRTCVSSGSGTSSSNSDDSIQEQCGEKNPSTQRNSSSTLDIPRTTVDAPDRAKKMEIFWGLCGPFPLFFEK